jgi:hypothetical protein
MRKENRRDGGVASLRLVHAILLKSRGHSFSVTVPTSPGQLLLVEAPKELPRVPRRLIQTPG